MRPARATPENSSSTAAPNSGASLEIAPDHRDQIKRLASALSHVKQRVHNPKLPKDACYAGVAYELPEPPMAAARLLYEALGPLPPGKTLDRIDPNGNYALANLRYATPKEQTANRWRISFEVFLS